MPLYYGNMLSAHVFAGGSRLVDLLVNETYSAAYAVYNVTNDGQETNTSTSLAHPVLVDKTNYNVKYERTYTAVELPGSAADAIVKRLMAPYVNQAINVTFAEQTVNVDGEVVEDVALEPVVNGTTVLVGQGEAVLVTL